MKTARLVAPQTLALFNESVSEIKEHKVLLKIKAVGICGSDLHRFRAQFNEDDPNYRLILGHEIAAEIVEVGSKVTELRPGDRVAVDAAIHCGECEWCKKGYYNLCPHVKFCGVPPTDGAFREYMAWPAEACFKLPHNLDFVDGVLAEVLGICLNAADLANLAPGMSAAILGSGPIGLGMLAVLKAMGIAPVYCTDIVPERCECAEKWGGIAMNPEVTDVAEEINVLTEGRGVDAVFECAGQNETMQQAVHLATPGGKVVIIGIPENDQHPFSASPARRKGLTFRFVRRGNLAYKRSFHLMQQGVINLREMVTHQFPLKDIQKAFELVVDYQDGAEKVIIQFD